MTFQQRAKYAAVACRVRRGRQLLKKADINWKHFALAAGASAALPLAVMGINKGVKSAYLGITKSRDFNEMLHANPDIREMDRVRVQRAFNTLRRFAPTMSQDPLVAGTWVKRSADYDMIDHKSIGELINAQRSVEKEGPVELNPAVGSMLIASKAGPSLEDIQAEAQAQAAGRAQVQPVITPAMKGFGEQYGRRLADAPGVLGPSVQYPAEPESR